MYRGTYRNNPVAFKVLAKVDEDSVKRFRQEIILMKGLRHTNVVMLIG